MEVPVPAEILEQQLGHVLIFILGSKHTQDIIIMLHLFTIRQPNTMDSTTTIYFLFFIFYYDKVRKNFEGVKGKMGPNPSIYQIIHAHA